jgi:hypothetical protein
MKRIMIVFCFMVFSSLNSFSQDNGFPRLKGPYLGQKFPGTVPEVFAPGVVSSDAHEFACSFSPDGMECYFSRRHPQLNYPVVMVSRLKDGAWTEPAIAPFVENQLSFEPLVTPDNKRLYFQSGKPIPGQAGPPMNILYVEREGGGWGAPKNPGPPFNPAKTMYISVTAGGTIYTTDISAGPGTARIAVIKRVNGEYQKLERLGPPINGEVQCMYPFIAADESYLIFEITSRLMISFMKPDASWSEPQPIDLGMNAGTPWVSADGRFLFFTGGKPGKSDIYWVDARCIERMKAKEMPPVASAPTSAE